MSRRVNRGNPVPINGVILSHDEYDEYLETKERLAILEDFKAEYGDALENSIRMTAEVKERIAKNDDKELAEA